MTSSTLWKLRRLAPRTIRVTLRHQDAHPVIGVFATSIVPKAEAFIVAYDASANYEVERKREMAEGKGALAALKTTLESWSPLLLRDIRTLGSVAVSDKTVPDDLMQVAERLIDKVETFTDIDGNALAYRDQALDQLETALEIAAKEWVEAEDANVTAQQAQANVRTTAGVFDTELQLLRRTVMAVLGKTHQDYQKLRANKASSPDQDDDPNAPTPTETKPASKDAQAPKK